MKRILTLLIVVVPLLAGCWSRHEVNDVAIVLGVALDKAKDRKLRLALQIAVPKASGGANASNQGSDATKSTLIVSAEGATIMEAYRTLQEKVPREIFFAHGRVIIVGEKLAKDGVSSILDFFSRHRQAHLRNYLLFTKGEAIDILQADPQFESALAEEIREKEKAGVGVRTRVREFWGRMLSEGEEPVAAQVSNLPLAASRNKRKGSEASKRVPAIIGAAIFQEDRLIGWLNDKEARGILWIRDELESGGVLAVSIPKEKGGGRIGAQIWNVSTKTKPIFRNGKLKIKIETYGEVELFENASRLDLSNPAVINTLQSMLEKDVKARIQLTLGKVQKELKSDIFGFGQAVYRANPKKWETYYKKKWLKIFPNIEIEIVPHITVKGTGFTTKSTVLPDTKR